MTEDQIERMVERAFDRLDARFLADDSLMTQAEYDLEAEAIHQRAKRQAAITSRAAYIVPPRIIPPAA